MFGFYFDYEKELSSQYTIDGNHMLNENQLIEMDDQQPGEEINAEEEAA